MKTTIKLFSLFLLGIIFSSCSNHLVGSWNIQKYETTKPDQQVVTLSNIGTITFYADGNGEKNVSYTVFGSFYEDNLRFKWSTEGELVTIDSQGSEFAKTWIMIENSRKVQRWQSTNGGTQVEILELKKVSQPSKVQSTKTNTTVNP